MSRLVKVAGLVCLLVLTWWLLVRETAPVVEYEKQADR